MGPAWWEDKWGRKNIFCGCGWGFLCLDVGGGLDHGGLEENKEPRIENGENEF